MVDAVNITGTKPVTSIGQPKAGSSTTDTSTKALQDAASGSTSSTSNSAASSQASALTALVYEDPLAGRLVSAQLNEQGLVVSQTPSSVVLSYLRNGLSIDGFPKQSTQTTTA